MVALDVAHITDADVQSVLAFALERARALGATAADAVLVENRGTSAVMRLGEMERTEFLRTFHLECRVFKGAKSARTQTTSLERASLEGAIQEALARIDVLPEDPYGGLPDPALAPQSWPDLETSDVFEPAFEVLAQSVGEMESRMRAVAGVTNSNSAEAGWRKSRIWLANSNGFWGARTTSHAFKRVAAIAGYGTAMQTDSASHCQVFWDDLEPDGVLGVRAGERAVRLLGAQKPKTGRVPVILSSRVSASLLDHLGEAISGAALVRQASFLKEALDTSVFAPHITIVDDGLKPRSWRSRPFDGESVACGTRKIIDEGRLTGWFLDVRTALELGLTPTGNGGRGSTPGPNTFYMEAGKESLEAFIGGISDGLYVTQFLGGGINIVTGEYSRGAAGFWIKNGVLEQPVNELTLSGLLPEMFAHLIPANDLEFRHGIDAPTILLPSMMVAGK